MDSLVHTLWPELLVVGVPPTKVPSKLAQIGDGRISSLALQWIKSIEITQYQGGSEMPRKIDGQHFYHTSELCQRIGISRPTLFRWLRRGILKKSYKDRRGWRLFTEDDFERIQAEARRIEVVYTSPGGERWETLIELRKAQYCTWTKLNQDARWENHENTIYVSW